MTKFKAGDKVVLVGEEGDTDLQYFTVGNVYTILGVNIESPFPLQIEDDTGDILGMSDRNFELFNPNQMPELKAGMVFKYDWGYAVESFLYIHEEMQIAITGYEGGDRSQPFEHGSSWTRDIFEVSETKDCHAWKDLTQCRFGSISPIWKKQSPKDIAIAKMEQDIANLQQNLTELKQQD